MVPCVDEGVAHCAAGGRQVTGQRIRLQQQAVLRIPVERVEVVGVSHDHTTLPAAEWLITAESDLVLAAPVVTAMGACGVCNPRANAERAKMGGS